jgi:glutamine synthetase
MSSGWHLHQSLVETGTGINAFARATPATDTRPLDARHALSDAGAHWLAGLLAHGAGMTALCTPTVNGYGRFRPNTLAPHAIVWGRDNRGAMLRVVGGAGDCATRIENRIGEPAANPYLYMASQIHAGLDGLMRGIEPPAASDSPYASQPSGIPTTLADALAALQADPALVAGLGADVVRHFCRIKQSEIDRHADAKDKADFERREYFSRI